MREILFRGKYIQRGLQKHASENTKWVYGSLILRDDYCCILESPEDIHPMDDPYLDGDLGTIDGFATPIDPDTVGQYTDLRDKNGKGIFEGDIVSTLSGKTFEVKFADGSFYLYGTSITIHHARKFIIVGNRWDNPELLEEGCGE